eukprot:scaffold192424_cov33-Tisochrysis_lutea.AAC.3
MASRWERESLGVAMSCYSATYRDDGPEIPHASPAALARRPSLDVARTRVLAIGPWGAPAFLLRGRAC